MTSRGGFILTLTAVLCAGSLSRAADLPSGFRVRPATAAELQACKLRRGALVLEAVPAADSDELKVGDVIAFVAGRPVATPAELADILSGAAGKKVEFLFYRDGRADTVELSPAPAANPASPANPAKIPEPPQTTARKAGNLNAGDWLFSGGGPPQASAGIVDGKIRFTVSVEVGGVHAIRRAMVKGDFDLEFDYSMDRWDPAGLLGGGLGLRLDSAPGWAGERLAGC